MLMPAVDQSRRAAECTHLETIQVIDCKHSAALVLVRNEAEALGFAGVPISHKVEVDDFAVPARHSDMGRLAGPQRSRHAPDARAVGGRAEARARGTHCDITAIRSPSVRSYGNPPT